MLSMQSISKIYRTDVVQTHALRDFSLEVKEGEFVAVMGPSGSGKTTFLNIAGLLESFDHGTYMLDGEDVSHLSDDGRSRIRNERIGFIFQSFNLIPDLNVFDNVHVRRRYPGFNPAARSKSIQKAMKTLGLTSRMKHLPSHRSRGQQQRVAIARARAGEPRILFADEPTGNPDSPMARQLLALQK